MAGEDEIDSKLRSFNEIMGYRIRATDGKMGQVHDILVDDEDRQIIYVIIDTSKWKPWSKKVILSIEWMDTIRLYGIYVQCKPVCNIDREIQSCYRSLWPFTFLSSFQHL